MTEHTPGPWVVENSRSRSLMVATKEFVLAQVLFAGVEPDDVDKANVRLIAAAPEMLVALQAIGDARGGVQLNTREIEAYRLVDAAIAKAIGNEK